MENSGSSAGKRKADGESITGYVMDVSPVKIAKTGKQYFRVGIQTANKRISNALCFSPSKRQLFNELCHERRGCTIDNVKSKKDVLYINDHSTVEDKELGFSRNPEVEYMTVYQVINQVPIDQQVNVRGVVILGELRNVYVRDQEVSIRDCYLVDERSCIKLTLWREYCYLLDNFVTYDLKQVLKMKYSGEICLQTVHSTTYAVSTTQIDDYQTIPRVEDQVLSGVKIDSVESLAPLCPECNKSVDHGDNSAVIKCNSCSKVMLSTALKRKKSHSIIVSNGTDKLKLFCHEEQLQLCFPDKDITSMDDSQLFLLLLTNSFNIHYKQASTHVTLLELSE